MTGVALAPSSSHLNQSNNHHNINNSSNSNHQHHHHHHQSYASSTLSSTTSSHNPNHTKKKSISPIIAESIKASANLSASNTNSDIVFEPPNSPVSKNQVIRMIDTDNEDVDLSNESSEPIRLDKLDEEEKQHQQQLDTSISTNYEKNMHPPSFKTAISSRPLFSSNFNSNNNSQSQVAAGYRHQYQNDIDLNIHPSTLPNIVQ